MASAAGVREGGLDRVVEVREGDGVLGGEEGDRTGLLDGVRGDEPVGPGDDAFVETDDLKAAARQFLQRAREVGAGLRDAVAPHALADVEAEDDARVGAGDRDAVVRGDVGGDGLGVAVGGGGCGGVCGRGGVPRGLGRKAGLRARGPPGGPGRALGREVLAGEAHERLPGVRAGGGVGVDEEVEERGHRRAPAEAPQAERAARLLEPVGAGAGGREDERGGGAPAGAERLQQERAATGRGPLVLGARRGSRARRRPRGRARARRERGKEERGRPRRGRAARPRGGRSRVVERRRGPRPRRARRPRGAASSRAAAPPPPAGPSSREAASPPPSPPLPRRGLRRRHRRDRVVESIASFPAAHGVGAAAVRHPTKTAARARSKAEITRRAPRSRAPRSRPGPRRDLLEAAPAPRYRTILRCLEERDSGEAPEAASRSAFFSRYARSPLGPADLAVALEGEDVRRDAVEEVAVVRHDDRAAGEGLESLLERRAASARSRSLVGSSRMRTFPPFFSSFASWSRLRSPPESCAHGLLLVGPAEEEARAGRPDVHLLLPILTSRRPPATSWNTVFVVVQRLAALVHVAEDRALPDLDRPRVGRLGADDHPNQRRLARCRSGPTTPTIPPGGRSSVSRSIRAGSP